MKAQAIVNDGMQSTSLASMKLGQGDHRIRCPAMSAFQHLVHDMLDAWYSEIPRHHPPSVGENIRVMDSYIITRQIQTKAGGKLLDHLHCALHDFDKWNGPACSGVKVDSQQLIPTSLMPDCKGRAVIGTKNSFPQQVKRNPRYGDVAHHADDAAFVWRSKQAGCSNQDGHEAGTATGERTEIRHMVQLQFSHHLSSKVTISQ